MNRPSAVEHSSRFSDERVPLLQVLDHFEADDHIEGRRCEKGSDVQERLYPAQVWSGVLRCRVRDRIFARCPPPQLIVRLSAS